MLGTERYGPGALGGKMSQNSLIMNPAGLAWHFFSHE